MRHGFSTSADAHSRLVSPFLPLALKVAFRWDDKNGSLDEGCDEHFYRCYWYYLCAVYGVVGIVALVRQKDAQSGFKLGTCLADSVDSYPNASSGFWMDHSKSVPSFELCRLSFASFDLWFVHVHGQFRGRDFFTCSPIRHL